MVEPVGDGVGAHRAVEAKRAEKGHRGAAGASCGCSIVRDHARFRFSRSILVTCSSRPAVGRHEYEGGPDRLRGVLPRGCAFADVRHLPVSGNGIDRTNAKWLELLRANPRRLPPPAGSTAGEGGTK